MPKGVPGGGLLGRKQYFTTCELAACDAKFSVRDTTGNVCVVCQMPRLFRQLLCCTKCLAIIATVLVYCSCPIVNMYDITL